VLCLAACAPLNPYAGFGKEIAQAKAKHVPILIYADSFTYYFGSNVSRTRTVSFVNTSGAEIEKIRFRVDQCRHHETIGLPEWFALQGPFTADAYYANVESTEPEEILERFVIQEIQVIYADGKTKTHLDDIPALLASNVSNFCPIATTPVR